MKQIYNPHYYKAFVERVIDGDTLELKIDLGFKIYKTLICRLYGINTAEISGKNKEEGFRVKRIVINELEKKNILVETIKNSKDEDKQEKYGRYLVIIYKDQINYNESLINRKLAVRYNI